MNSKPDPTDPDAPLRPRSAPPETDPERFRALGHELVDRIAEFLGGLRDRPVTTGESPEAIRSLLSRDAALPEQGEDPAELLRSASQLLFDHSLFNGHPRFLGYVTSSPAPIGMLGDLLASAVNPNVGAWALSPMATEIEAQTVRWVADLVGYPRDCGGLFVSGGNMANFVGFLAARSAMMGPRVREAGVGALPAARVYASVETHTWLQKAVDLFGLGTESIRWIETDEELRIDLRSLRAAVEEDRAAGLLPMLVVGSAGTVSTGAIDPLSALADFCRQEGIWFHVDGAYGGFAAIAPDAPRELAAMAEADSVAVDPHKWLYAPLEAGCILVRQEEALRNAFSYHPPYYHFGTEAINYFDLGMQNSRGFRALKVWLAIQQIGRVGYASTISDDLRLSRRLHENLDRHPEFEALTQGLSVTTFRYVPPELRDRIGHPETEAYLNDLNERLLEETQQSGEAFVSNAVLSGRFALRACVVNFRTSDADMDALPDLIARHGRRVHAARSNP